MSRFETKNKQDRLEARKNKVLKEAIQDMKLVELDDARSTKPKEPKEVKSPVVGKTERPQA